MPAGRSSAPREHGRRARPGRRCSARAHEARGPVAGAEQAGLDGRGLAPPAPAAGGRAADADPDLGALARRQRRDRPGDQDLLGRLDAHDLRVGISPAHLQLVGSLPVAVGGLAHLPREARRGGTEAEHRAAGGLVLEPEEGRCGRDGHQAAPWSESFKRCAGLYVVPATPDKGVGRILSSRVPTETIRITASDMGVWRNHRPRPRASNRCLGRSDALVTFKSGP